MLGRALPVALLLVAALATAPAAAECGETTGYSRCLDASAFWARPGAGPWLALPASSAVAPGKLGAGVLVGAALQPLVLEVPSASPDGREVRLVDAAVDQSTLLAAGLGAGFEAGVVLTTIAWQRGAGVGGITSQRAAPLPRTGARDPRLALAYAFRPATALGVKPRLELGLPLGDDDAFASEGALAVAPGAAFGAELGRFAFGLNLGLRLRRSVPFGSLRWGSQAELGLGASAEAIERRLSFALEAFALPAITGATSERGEASAVDVRLVPAEWLASASLRFGADRAFWLSAGAGSGLALSAETRDGVERAFYGPTSPKLRATLALRWAPTR